MAEQTSHSMYKPGKTWKTIISVVLLTGFVLIWLETGVSSQTANARGQSVRMSQKLARPTQRVPRTGEADMATTSDHHVDILALRLGMDMLVGTTAVIGALEWNEFRHHHHFGQGTRWRG